MIEVLRIENLAIVESEELEFGPGLNVLTGETGAGKSIVLGALSLLAGGRATPQLVREGAEEAVAEAIFRTEHLAALEDELERRGFENDEHELVVRRSVARGGRSRARLSGQLVPAGALAELFAGRVEISSQHDSQSLLRPDMHGLLLDRAGDLLDARQAVAQGYAELRALDAELSELRAAEADRERRRDFLAFQLDEIDAAELDAEQIAELRTERSRLAHAERLMEETATAVAALSGDLADGEQANAADCLAEAARRLESVEKLDPQLAALRERAVTALEDVRDTSRELERYAAGVEVDPARLAAADERLAAVEALGRKYGGDVEAVLRFRDDLAAERDALEGASERAEAIEAIRAKRAEQLAAYAALLTKGRRRAAKKLARSVEGALHELAMPQARFAVALDPAPPTGAAPCGPTGSELPEFRFASASEGELLPLRRVASGGELSRIFLALKSAVRTADAGMVLVFDEVDAGIGGRTADRVGRVLAELAGQHQVLCITHLPQIAAYATTHFRVEKADCKGRSRVRVVRVEGPDRVEEIARMAGGEDVGEATRRHARELLRARSTP